MAGVRAIHDRERAVRFTNRPPPLMMNQRNRRGRNSGRGMGNDTIAVHRRDRPGDDQLRGGVRRHEGAGAAGGRHPAVRGAATRRAGRDGAAADAPVVPLPAGRSRAAAGRGAAALGRRGRPDRRRVRPDPGGGVPGRLVGSAKSWLCHPGRRSRGRHPPLGQPAGGREGLAGRGVGRPTCGTSATPGTTRSPATTPTRRLEQQEVVLTVPASFDEAARELTLEAAKRAGLDVDHAARGAAGGVLLLDRLAPGRLAARGPGRRADPGLRHRRRHDRLQPDHRRRDADRARASAAWPSAIT